MSDWADLNYVDNDGGAPNLYQDDTNNSYSKFKKRQSARNILGQKMLNSGQKQDQVEM
jgi:hypothetical protein